MGKYHRFGSTIICKPYGFKNKIKFVRFAHLHRFVRRHKRSEHRLEVGAPRQHDRHVRRNDVAVQHQIDITEWFAARFQEDGQIVLERRALDLFDFHLRLGRIEAPPDDLYHQRFGERIELLGHDDLVHVLLFDDETEAQLLDQTEPI